MRDTGDDVRSLLLWLRSQRIAVTRVRVGDTELDIAVDMELAPQAPSLSNDRPPQDPYEVFGGAALKRLREDQARQASEVDNLIEED